MDNADGHPVDKPVDNELDKPVQGLDEPGDEEEALPEEELKLPEPIPDVSEDDRLEEQIRSFTREAASETLRRCGELLQKKPERALNLIELYVHASRKFLVELAEPESDLSRSEGRIPLPVLGAAQNNIAIGNGYQLGGALQQREGNRYHDEQLLQEAHEGLLRRGEEHPLLPLARTYAQGLRMILARASAMGPEVLSPMTAAVKESLGEELSEELLGIFSSPLLETRVPCTLEEAAGDLSEEELRPFEALLDEQELVFEPELPEEIQISEIPSFDELLEGALFKMKSADIDLAEGDLDAIDRALDEDDEEEAEEAEQELEEAGLGLAGGDRQILRQLQRQVRQQRRVMNRLIPNPYRNPLHR